MRKPKPVRLQHKKLGTVVRIIRIVEHRDGLAFRCRDETYGGLSFLPITQYTEGHWEVVSGNPKGTS